MNGLKSAIFRLKPQASDRYFNLEEAQCVLMDILKDFDTFCAENNLQYSLAYGSLIGAHREGKIIPWDDDIDLMMRRDEFDKLLTLLNKLNDYNLSAYHYTFVKHTYTNEIRIYKKGYFRVLEDNGKEFLTPLCVDIFPINKVFVPETEGDKEIRQYLLEKLTKYKGLLILKEAKYNSRSKIRACLRKCKKILHSFPTSASLHKGIEKTLLRLSSPEGEYKLFSPYANDNCDACFEREVFEKYQRVSFGGLDVSSIADYDLFLSKMYGDWKTPIDSTDGKTNKIKFLERR